MSEDVRYAENCASYEEIVRHINACNETFIPSLSSRVNINAYVKKIIEKAQRFEAWKNGELIGLVAAYCNSVNQQTAFITSVSVLSDWQGKKIATQLLAQCVKRVHKLGYACIELEVDINNSGAIALYLSNGFSKDCICEASQKMVRNLIKEER